METLSAFGARLSYCAIIWNWGNQTLERINFRPKFFVLFQNI
jgi:hypothetical protein